MDAHSTAQNNVRLFILFRILFNARFYYPVFAVLFLDLGLTMQQFAMVNVVWAISIILLEVPSGAVADQIGRRTMVVIATFLMVIEIGLIAFVPLGNSSLIFWAIILNRILSGAAEAAASGADEALAYDSLLADGREGEWPRVLELLMRVQAVAFIVTSLTGAVVFHAPTMNRVLGWIGLDTNFPAEVTLRFPIYLTLGMAFAAVTVSLLMREPAPVSQKQTTFTTTVRQILSAAKWILATPMAMALIVVALCFDSFVRLFLTFNSSYYRLIEIPEVAFGVIGATFALLGFFIAPVGRRLVAKWGAGTNFAALGVLIFLGLLGVGLSIPGFGVFFILPLGAAMFLMNFFLSHYLNALVESASRATVLSFKNLCMNISYAIVGAGFGIFVEQMKSSPHDPRSGDVELDALALALPWLPWAFLCTAPLILIFAVRAKNRPRPVAPASLA